MRGSNIALFPSSTPEDVREAIDAADNAFRSWKRTPLAERQNYIAEFLRLLKESREELARIVTLENGKTIKESRAEVDSALVEGSYHLNQVAAFSGHSGPGAFRDISTWVQYQPLGVVGIISPWNFPMNVMNRKALPALLTGNTVVFKPATFTPWSGVFMAQLLERAGLPAGVFNCVTGLGSSHRQRHRGRSARARDLVHRLDRSRQEDPGEVLRQPDAHAARAGRKERDDRDG